MTDKFPCTGCGACCRRIHNLKDYSDKLALDNNMPEISFPYGHNNGACEKLIDNKCSVYEDRPLICNVDKMQEILKIDKSIFYKMNADVCNDFIKESGMDESFLINLQILFALYW